MGKYLINKIFAKLKTSYFGEFPQLSYSRSGEDLLLDDIFNHKSSGFYVDIGSFHPINYSNTFKFYLKGWTGINIDPNKEVMDLFKKTRSNDLNLNLAVSETAGTHDYFMNTMDPSMNTISDTFASESSQKYGFEIAEKRVVTVKRLEDIIRDSNCDLSKIDFFNIDVEGHDFEVLKSNDWNDIRPKVVLIEMNCGIEEVRSSDIYKFLLNKNYSLLSYTYLNYQVGNGFFINNDLK
jgi:FkbM family methyltransferase